MLGVDHQPEKRRAAESGTDIGEFLAASEEFRFEANNREEFYGWATRTLVEQEYGGQKREADYCFAERQSWFRAVPVHELVNGVEIAALSVRAGKAAENSGLRDFKVWQSQDRFTNGALFFTTWISFHHLWPPTPPVHTATNDTRPGSEWRVIRPERRLMLPRKPRTSVGPLSGKVAFLPLTLLRQAETSVKRYATID